jgi:hypothetical protein
MIFRFWFVYVGRDSVPGLEVVLLEVIIYCSITLV